MSGQLGKWGLDTVHCVDALTLLRGLPDASVDLIATDPPFNIGKADWDSWATLDDYLAWLDDHLREFKRVLKPNGSLYLFCASQYQAEVHMTVKRHLNVLNNIRWRKENGWHKKAAEEDARSYFPASETVIFAEQFGADAITPLGDAIRVARERAGLRATEIDVALGYVRSKDPLRGTELCRRWEEGSSIPSSTDFQRALQVCSMSADYEDLLWQYEIMRRPFYATADAPYTDVWDFATVNTYPGKHICEKPLDMCQHIVRVSSRRGALVLDPFCGSGNLLRAAFVEGRHYIGGDSDPHWARKAADWIPQPFDVPLFSEAQL